MPLMKHLAGLAAFAFVLNFQDAQAHFENRRRPLTRTTSTLTTHATATASAAASPSASLNATVLDCFLTLPNDPLSATGLSTPFLLQPPCSMSVSTQQAFAEAAVFDPATGDISIYHPLVIDAGKKPAAPPVVPQLPENAKVALWFGFNGNVLQLLDVNGEDTNTSPLLKSIDCVNGLPGVQGDVFGQVSWCNTKPFFAAANASIAAGKTTIPPLGTDKNGAACPTSRSFEIVDACPSDNVPTQYLLLPDGSTVQDTAANRARFPDAEVINNASDEALVANILDPILGCTPFEGASLDDPGAKVPALALAELQAGHLQQAPVALVPLNDPDTLLTANGQVSPAKTNAYRLGVNQPLLSSSGADDGALVPYCDNMIAIAPGFFKANEAEFSGQPSPDTGVGNNLFTFMCNRYLMSLTQLGCPADPNQPVQVTLDGNGAATSCTINLGGANGKGSSNVVSTSKTSASTAVNTAAGTATTKVSLPTHHPNNGSFAGGHFRGHGQGHFVHRTW
ncbi:hypothetical protein VTN77DRAFT_1438 [Rasamsonia byssochlamydoides]|uniref:uncharacterized protein n=1 Tax=Rasamsonia byssochlamydoides TaxID=89139 RepID=UPI00374232C6